METDSPDPRTGVISTRTITVSRPWLEPDGTFYWILPAGKYRIEALAWGVQREVILGRHPDERLIHPKPGVPPECGFVVSLNVNFAASGACGVLYVGSLLIGMDIKKGYGVEVERITSFEIKDEYDEAQELFKSRYPSCTLTVEKQLMTDAAKTPVSVANGHCPTWGEAFLGEILKGILELQWLPRGL
jgi:hypothetical protein